MHETVVLIASQTETGSSQIAAEYAHPGLQVVIKLEKFQVGLHSAPEPKVRLLSIARTHQKIQRCAVLLQQIGGDVRPDVSGGSGQKYRHVAPLVPVLTASPFAGAS